MDKFEVNEINFGKFSPKRLDDQMGFGSIRTGRCANCSISTSKRQVLSLNTTRRNSWRSRGRGQKEGASSKP